MRNFDTAQHELAPCDQWMNIIPDADVDHRRTIGSVNASSKSFVFDQSNRCCKPPGSCGSVKLKTVPRPSSLLAQARPPWPCTMCLTIESPNPVPPCSRERALSTL